MSSSKVKVSPVTEQPLTTQEKFFALREEVLKRKPVLRHIVEKHGYKTLYEYARDYIQVNLNPPIQRRQDELISVVQRTVTDRLGEDAGVKVAEQLKKYYFVSTTDHHGPICHPFFINGNLISSATYFEHPDPTLQYIIVMACANVSLNNSSFPRGLIFHGDKGDEQELHRLSFSPSSDRLCPVYGYKPYAATDLARMKQELQKKVSNNQLTDETSKKIASLIDEVYGSPRALASSSYSEQITITNDALWKKFFRPNGHTAPGLLYIEQEGIVADLLVQFHLHENTVINHLLFNPKMEKYVTTYFEGINGAFSMQEQSGTYFFWAVPPGQKYRQQLWKKDNELVTADGSYRIPLTPEAIAEGLRTRELIPSMLLSFILLSFYYGLKCLGGFSQVNYLTFMKRSYVKMMADLEYYKSIEVCARVQTKELCGEVTLAFLKNKVDGLMPATGLDLILYGNDFTWKQFVDLSKEISVAEALNPLMSEFYKIIYSEQQRDPELAALTPEEITQLTGLDKKIKPCASL